MRVIVWFQLLLLVRMVVRAGLSLMLVFVLLRVAWMGMLVRMPMLVFVLVGVVVFVSVRGPIVGVLMGVRMSMLVLVFPFHRSPPSSSPVRIQLRQPNLSAT